MLHHWHLAVDKGESVRTVFVDHVDHNMLIAKMVALSLPGVIVRWTYDIITARVLCAAYAV